MFMLLSSSECIFSPSASSKPFLFRKHRELRWVGPLCLQNDFSILKTTFLFLNLQLHLRSWPLRQQVSVLQAHFFYLLAHCPASCPLISASQHLSIKQAGKLEERACFKKRFGECWSFKRTLCEVLLHSREWKGLLNAKGKTPVARS